MVDFGAHNNPDDMPTSTHIRRAARKYNGHKLARAVGHEKVLRARGGESTKK